MEMKKGDMRMRGKQGNRIEKEETEEKINN